MLLTSGCGHLGLARRTILHGSTLSDMQYQQVLDNLAMFSCNPDALAWHVKITGGVVQLADQGAGGIASNLGGPGILAPSGSLQRNVLGQWNIDPVIETEELELLQIAYNKALNPFDPDGSIKRDAYAKICDLANSYHISVSRDIALDMIDVMSEGATPTQTERITQIRFELVRLYDEIDRESITVLPYDQKRIDRTGPEVTNKVEYLREQVIRLLFEACQRRSARCERIIARAATSGWSNRPKGKSKRCSSCSTRTNSARPIGSASRGSASAARTNCRPAPA